MSVWDYLRLLNTVRSRDEMPVIRSLDDVGYNVSRSRSRSTMHRLTVTYVMDTPGRCALLEFRDANRAGWFDYRMHDMNATYPARFASEIAFEDFAPGWFTATFDLEVYAPDIVCIYGEAPAAWAQTISYSTFYLSNNVAAPASPAYHSTWENTTYAIRRKLLPHATTDADGIVEATFGDGNWPGSLQDWLLVQFVSDGMAAQTLSGTIRGQIQGLDTVGFTGGAGGEVYASIMARVVSNDGSTQRGTIYALTLGATGLVNAFTNRKNPLSASLSSLAVQSGDRLVIEIGISRSSASVEPVVGGNQFLKLRHGSKVGGVTTLLPVDETDTSSTKVPWVQFGTPIAFEVTI